MPWATPTIKTHDVHFNLILKEQARVPDRGFPHIIAGMDNHGIRKIGMGNHGTHKVGLPHLPRIGIIGSNGMPQLGMHTTIGGKLCTATGAGI